MLDIKTYEPIANAICALFHPYVEVVLHDLKNNSIAAIYNNFSNRKHGDSSGLENLQGLAQGPLVHGPHQKRASDGSRIKYVSAVLKDRSGEAVGMMCINVNVQVFDQIAGALQMFLNTSSSEPLDAMFEDDWQGRINTFVHDYLREHGRTPDRLDKAGRIDLVHSLHKAGAFSAKNAAAYVANVLGVSRATIYNDLNQIESGQDGGP